MNKITLVTDWLNHDGSQGWLEWLILAGHWPSVSVATAFLLVFDLSHAWLSPLAILLSELFLIGRRWMHTIGPSLFLNRGGCLGWEKVCTTVLFFYQPLKFEDLERSAVSCSDWIMRLLRGNSQEKYMFHLREIEGMQRLKEQSWQERMNEWWTIMALEGRFDPWLLKCDCEGLEAVCFSLWWACVVLTVNSSCLGPYNIRLMRC